MKVWVEGLMFMNGENRKTGRRTYYVYLLLCDDGSYYTGYTNNLASRFERHKRGRGARYTRMRRPKKVEYVEAFRTRGAAIKRERQIKALSHREKHELVSVGLSGKSRTRNERSI